MLLLISVMIISGIIKDLGLMTNVVCYVSNYIKNPKILAGVISAITGILPIKGRVIVSAGILHSIYKKSPALGPLNYIATHHYYLWSPLEKAVIVAMGAFGLSYVDWLLLMSPLLVISAGFICWYISVCGDDIQFDSTKTSEGSCLIVPPYLLCLLGCVIWNPIWSFCLLTIYCMVVYKQYNVSKYIDWKLVCWFGFIILASNIAKTYTDDIYKFVERYCADHGLLVGTMIGFFSSLALGSSSRFSTITVILTLIFGVQYLLWFYIVDFAGYVLSPAHKCVSIGKQYFKTPLISFYGVLLVWIMFLIISAAVITYI